MAVGDISVPPPSHGRQRVSERKYPSAHTAHSGPVYPVAHELSDVRLPPTQLDGVSRHANTALLVGYLLQYPVSTII